MVATDSIKQLNELIHRLQGNSIICLLEHFQEAETRLKNLLFRK